MKTVLNCPFCNQSNTVELVKESRTHIVNDMVLEGEFMVYKCSLCGEGFTTDETDEFSIKNLKQKQK